MKVSKAFLPSIKMDITKIILIAIVFTIIIVYLKSVNQDFALLATIVASVILLMMVIDAVVEVFSVYQLIANTADLSTDSIKIVIKVTVICYLVEFASGIIEDFGVKSLADKVSLAGKILILAMSAPIIKSLMGIITKLVT